MRVLLFSLVLLMSTAAWACMCPSIASMSDVQASLMAKQQVLAAEEILRVRVLSLTRVGNNKTTFIVQVQEALKSNSIETIRKVATGPDSCNLSMELNDEWLLFVYKGHVSQCSGSWFLGTTSGNFAGLSSSEAVAMYERERSMAARWIALVRGALKGEAAR